MEKTISRETVARLPKYLRYLQEYIAQGCSKISSGELSKRLGITSSQVRRDLGQLEVSGHNGFGYLTQDAYKKVSNELGLNTLQKTVIIGVEGIGHTIVSPAAFRMHGFEAIGLYDTDPALIGEAVGELTVKDLSELGDDMQKEQAEIALLLSLKTDVRAAAEAVAAAGIGGILNFTPIDLELPDTEVENIHIDDRLMLLSYRLRSK